MVTALRSFSQIKGPTPHWLEPCCSAMTLPWIFCLPLSLLSLRRPHRQPAFLLSTLRDAGRLWRKQNLVWLHHYPAGVGLHIPWRRIALASEEYKKNVAQWRICEGLINKYRQESREYGTNKWGTCKRSYLLGPSLLTFTHYIQRSSARRPGVTRMREGTEGCKGESLHQVIFRVVLPGFTQVSVRLWLSKSPSPPSSTPREVVRAGET